MTIAMGRTSGRAGARIFFFPLTLFFSKLTHHRHNYYGFDYYVYYKLDLLSLKVLCPLMESHCAILSPHIHWQPLFYHSHER